ncbi:hypothetical protein niasHT_015773 [Heterodera trifolii]|uniref:Orc1-like AAA ATPase domain-containing protein n=1 Tax=Heterodera trifolii TaxID=157864 RepID=A0ABD2L5Z8_9BILA
MVLQFSSEQKRLLGLGRVPSLRRGLLPRTSLSDQLYHRLKTFLTDPDSEWFLVHGLVGTGKSELVTKVLWERPELCFALVDRILWVTDRRFRPTELGQLAADTLLLAASLNSPTNFSQMDEFDAFFGCSQSADKSGELSSVAHSLHSLLNDNFAKTLLIVDGVQMAESVKFFDQIKGRMCKILATSTSRTLFNWLENIQTFKVPSDNCSGEELAQMAQNYGIKETFSAERINAILCETGGNFALLEKMFVMARGCPAIFDSLLAQLRHSPLSLVSCHSAYYNFNLEDSLRQCFKMVDDGSLICSFGHCAAIGALRWTNFEIFCLIWPFDVCGSELVDEIRALIFQKLDTLEANSLLDKSADDVVTFDGYDHFAAFRFRLHPLVHNFLQHSRQNSFDARQMLSKLRDSPLVPNGRAQIYAEYLAKNEQRLIAIQENSEQKQKHIDSQRLKNGRNQSNGRTFEEKNSTDGGRRGGKAIWTTETIGRWIRRAMGKNERRE